MKPDVSKTYRPLNGLHARYFHPSSNAEYWLSQRPKLEARMDVEDSEQKVAGLTQSLWGKQS